MKIRSTRMRVRLTNDFVTQQEHFAPVFEMTDNFGPFGKLEIYVNPNRILVPARMDRRQMSMEELRRFASNHEIFEVEFAGEVVFLGGAFMVEADQIIVFFPN